MAERIVLAMSGGVDSSVAAVLLKQQGWDVVGLFMRTGVEHEPSESAGHKQGCCSVVDAGDARRVADRLNVPFFALDFRDEFGRIIDYFADEYLAGRTPNPCVVCNTWLKFGRLWEFAEGMGATAIATGHYARIIRGPNGAELHRGSDPNKDQSYVLSGIRREILERIHFPIGELPKSEVRQLAADAGLGVADKPDSFEICFVPNQDHASVVRARRPGHSTAGNIVDRSGTVLAEHDGFDRFTVGQRKGLGVAVGQRRFVLEIVPETHTVVVGEKEELLAPGLQASRMNWLADVGSESFDAAVKIRYRHDPAPANVTVVGDVARIRFVEPQSAITPGQAVAVYRGDQVLGGGWIDHALHDDS